MNTDQNISKMTYDELIVAQKKAKTKRIISAVLIGAFIGVAVYAATHHKGFILTVFLLIVPFWFARESSQHLNDIQAELSSRETTSN
jgi:hypothetical protein